MRVSKYIFIYLLFVILASCASSGTTTEQRQQFYRDSAERNERLAEDWHNRNIHYMADYHLDEASRDRHNEFAEGCGIAEMVLFDILLDGDTCRFKH